MDFGELLHVAQRNEHKAKKEPKKCYSTSFSAPKKELKGGKSLSANIQKFLARKEEEEKRKEQEAKQKRDDLLALRSQDGKAKKRVAAMLKRTKAANKSAIEDAVDDDNTAVTLNGPSQPDEDDYGYVSQEASAYYNKLMDKYNSAPVEEPLYSKKKKTIHRDLNSTKDRVRMALQREEEEEMMPHKRRRRTKHKKEDDPGDTTVNYHSSDLTDLGSGNTGREVDFDSDLEMEPEKPINKPKPKKAAPPLMNFQDLLKLAEKKQFEPIKIEPKKKPDDEEDHRPMTKKQKLEYLKEQEWRHRKEEAAKSGRSSNNQVHSSNRIPKMNNRDDQTPNQRTNTMDRGQERPSGSGQQMKIPKISHMKREEKQEGYTRGEARPSASKRDDRSVSTMKREENGSSQNLYRQNGGISRENSYNTSSKQNLSSRDEQAMKRIQRGNDIVPKMSRTDSESASVQRSSSIREDFAERSKLKNDYMSSTPNSVKRLPLKNSEIKQDNDHNKLKNIATSGYDKKLQDAITAKMQEYQKKKKLEETALSKSMEKSVINKDMVSRAGKEIESSSQSRKMQGKLLSRSDHSLQPKTSLINQKTSNTNSGSSGSSSNISRSSQEQNSSLNSKNNAVPSSKPRMLPPETKPKAVPSSASRQTASGNVKINSAVQMNSRVKPASSPDAQHKQVPSSENRPRQISTSAVKPKQVASSDRPKQISPADVKPKKFPSADVHPRQFPPQDVRPKQFPPTDVRPKQFPPSDVRPKQFPPPDVRPKHPPPDVRPKQFPPPDVRPKQFPPPDVRPKQFPPPDVRPKQFPPPDVRKNAKPPLKRRITESEEEYDSEMDDFIDDGPEEEEDYSKHIREIFGYDRRKYSRITDDDDECMESNFATILKEDFISTKSGILEDLEDIRREKEMERRKKLAKKKKL